MGLALDVAPCDGLVILMSKMRSLLGVVALLVAGCGQSANVTVEPSDELLSATQAAIEVWRPALESCGRSLDIGSGATIKYGDTGGVYALTSHADPHDVVVNRELLESDQKMLTETLIHELGHVLGAKHTDDPADIMFPTPSPEKTGVPTPADVAQVCAQ